MELGNGVGWMGQGNSSGEDVWFMEVSCKWACGRFRVVVFVSGFIDGLGLYVFWKMQDFGSFNWTYKFNTIISRNY